MSGFDWGAIADNELEAERRRLMLAAFERQRARAKELEAEEAARTAAPDPHGLEAKIADPAYYRSQVKVTPMTATDEARDLFFTMLSSGGAQAPLSPGSVGTSVYEQLGAVLSAFDQVEPRG